MSKTTRVELKRSDGKEIFDSLENTLAYIRLLQNENSELKEENNILKSLVETQEKVIAKGEELENAITQKVKSLELEVINLKEKLEALRSNAEIIETMGGEVAIAHHDSNKNINFDSYLEDFKTHCLNLFKDREVPQETTDTLVSSYENTLRYIKDSHLFWGEERIIEQIEEKYINLAYDIVSFRISDEDILARMISINSSAIQLVKRGG